MNKSELIDKLEKRVLFFSNHTDEYTKGVVDAYRYSLLLFNQMNEDKPQQPKTPTTSNPKASLHSNITKELNDIYIAKNADYGDAFGETYKKLGIVSAVTRITDKVNRLQSLATKSDEERLVKDESIVDTLKDLSNYALMTLIEMGYEPVDEDSHSINAGGTTLNEMDIDLNEAMKAFARIGS